MMRFGMAIGVKPESLAEYKALHGDSHPGVRDLLTKYHLRNFSIYLAEIGGKPYLFGYYEYDGVNYAADMAKLDAEPRNIEWHSMTDAMQIPLPGNKLWAPLESVYFNG
jgi:L-rhamnose mutarotase